MIKNGEIALAINTSDNKASKDDAKTIRQSVLSNNVAYFTTVAAARATALAIKELKSFNGEIEPKAIQDYLGVLEISCQSDRILNSKGQKDEREVRF
jgi:carbamoyl-phosphate synthase large subunit